MADLSVQSLYRGSGSITREQFLFYEMRITARFITEGLSDDEIIRQVVFGNLFQYPTERMIKQMSRKCLKRLKS